MEKSDILHQYNNYCIKYKKIYGENTVVLIQIGGFFEIYYYEGENLGEPDIHYLYDDVLNMENIGVKRNKNYEYLMAGFPIIAKDKYFGYLLERGYTTVLIEQLTKGAKAERDFTQILSPGTDIEYTNKTNNYLMSIYIEKIGEYLTIGISSIDLSTGKSYIHYVSPRDNNFCIGETSRFIHYYNPSEAIFQTRNFELTEQDIVNNWGLNCPYRINHFTDTIYRRPSYQNELLSDIFRTETMLTPIQELELSGDEMRLSFVYLLVFVRDHKIDMLSNIHRPIEVIDRDYMILTSTTSRQLNVVDNYSYYRGKNDCLLSICDCCSTAMGSRLFRSRLLYPSIDIETIQKRYNKIEHIVPYIDELRSELHHIIDHDKSLRQMSLKTTTPSKIRGSTISYNMVKSVFDKIKNFDLSDDYKEYFEIESQFKQYLEELKSTFDFDKITNISLEDYRYSIFKYGVFDNIDDIDRDITDYTQKIENIQKRLCKFIDDTKTDVIKVVESKEDGTPQLRCTNNRSILLKKKFKKIVVDDVEIMIQHIKFTKHDKSTVNIEIPILTKYRSKLAKLYKRISKFNVEIYNDTMDYLYNTYNIALQKTNESIADVDSTVTGAKIQRDNNYSKPEIVDSEKSFIDIRDMRHPIVERIDTSCEYITNDIVLGDIVDGVLLFGTNACGKSTFMKAIGLNLVMAQAGLYVASSSFRFSPYTKIFTRILNNDNIFRSQSTFAVEMEEIKTIIDVADHKTLVLGDEVCNGTETTSAISIVYSTIKHLCNVKSSFVFTSHFHQLTKIPDIHELHNLSIYHLTIDNIHGKLIYNRKLKPGSGPPIYGIRVCEALGLPQHFLDNAIHIQKQIENTGSVKTSPYNPNVIVDKCGICGESATETHHIKEQCSSDSNDMIDHHHKNIDHNLVPLCKKCHDATTYGNLIISGYIQTSSGRELQYHYVEQKKMTRKKYDDKMVKSILKYQKLFELNRSECLAKIKLELNLSIGSGTLRRIMTENY